MAGIRRLGRMFGVAAMASIMASPAVARDEPEWTMCDFGPDPQAGVFGRGRWLNNGMHEGAFVEAVSVGRGPATLKAAIAACTAMLDRPELTAEQWLRRISLLQARAAHRIDAGDAAGALGDLDQVAALIPATADRMEVDRSLTAGTLMLRAEAFSRLGRKQEAAEALTAAASRRPWNSRLQRLAGSMLVKDRAKSSTKGENISAGELAIADQRLRLDNDARSARAMLRFVAEDYAGSLHDWRLVRPAPGELTQSYISVQGVTVRGMPGIPVRTVDPSRLMSAALAAVLAGDGEQARRWIAQAKTTAQNLPAPSQFEINFNAIIDKDQLTRELNRRSRLIDAAIALEAGDKAKARALFLGATPLALDLPTLAFGRRVLPEANLDAAIVNEESGDRNKGEASATESTAIRPPVEARAIYASLPRYDAGNNRNGYSGQIPFFKASGFKTTPMADGRGVTVRFLGETSMATAVEEMTLLRAAELAKEAGKTAFLILERRDLKQTKQFTYGGSRVGNAIPAGFITELDVAFVDPTALPPTLADEADRLIPADQVIAALAPIYKKTQ